MPLRLGSGQVSYIASLATFLSRPAKRNVELHKKLHAVFVEGCYPVTILLSFKDGTFPAVYGPHGKKIARMLDAACW
jgi:hypothetical protein